MESSALKNSTEMNGEPKTAWQAHQASRAVLLLLWEFGMRYCCKRKNRAEADEGTVIT